MNKGKGSINAFKGGGIATSNSKVREDKAQTVQSSLSEATLRHSSLGEYNTLDRPKSGGHGQESIEYMEAHGIPYEINTKYSNGVRAGNLPSHKDRMFQTGNRHTWFPKSWSRQDIAFAGEYVAKQFKGKPYYGIHHSAVFKGVKVTVIIGERGEVKTVFPAADQPGGIKND